MCASSILKKFEVVMARLISVEIESNIECSLTIESAIRRPSNDALGMQRPGIGAEPTESKSCNGKKVTDMNMIHDLKELHVARRG